MQFDTERKRKLVAVGISAAMLLGIFTACSIDYAGLSEGLNDLGNAMDFGYSNTPATPEETSSETTSEATSSETKETSESTSETASETTETSETETSGSSETSETSEPSETSSSSETSETDETTASESSIGTSETTTEETTPTPTPHPSNERVDFSNLTNSKLADNFTVDTEEFSESVEADQKAMAIFSGKRMLVSKAESDNVTQSVNLILDSFYQEAAGLYSRYSGEAKAAYNLSGTIDTVYTVEVNYDYSFNKRILSVIMSYKVTAGKSVLASSEEFASFDMLTGQYITLASVASDMTGLENALKVKLANNTTGVKAGLITDLYVMVQHPGAQTATVEIYGTYNGERIHTTGDMNEYAQYLNRFGKLVYGVTEEKPAEQ